MRRQTGVSLTESLIWEEGMQIARRQSTQTQIKNWQHGKPMQRSIRKSHRVCSQTPTEMRTAPISDKKADQHVQNSHIGKPTMWKSKLWGSHRIQASH